MEEKDRPCECCNGNDFIAGVASCGIAAFSFNWCQICLAVGANPKFIIDGSIESCGGLDKVHEDVALIYYDPDKDQYINLREPDKPVTITLKDGMEFTNKTELVLELKRREKEKNVNNGEDNNG
jgi:hypothetical protein